MTCGRKIGEFDCCSVVEGDAASFLPQIDADLVVTDPPYGIAFKSNRQGVDRLRSNRREGDIVVREDFFTEIENDSNLPTDWLRHLRLQDGAALYVFCHWSKLCALAGALAHGFTIKNTIVLNKSNHGMGDLKGQYAPKHEFLLFATKGRHILRWPNGRGKDVWDVPIKFTGSHRLHPNEKPLSWMEPAILNSSDAGQLVLDPFCGSGSTLVAAKKLGRHFLGIEIEPKYVAIARQRLAEVPFADALAPANASI